MEDTEQAGGSLITDLQVQATNRLMEALFESEARMRRRINLLSEVVFELDLAGQVVFLNDAWTHSLGLSAAASLGRPLAAFVLPEDCALLDATLADARAGQPSAADLAAVLWRSPGGALDGNVGGTGAGSGLGWGASRCHPAEADPG